MSGRISGIQLLYPTGQQKIIHTTIIFLLLVVLLFCAEHVTGKAGLLVIPGLGRSDRLATVIANLKMLDSYLSGENSDWDCIVYIYASFADNTFWGMKAEIDYITSMCDIVENPGKMVTDNLFMVQPALLRLSYRYVFILLDDCKLLGDDEFALGRLLNLMKLNNLTVASPMVISANKGGGQGFRKIMQKEAQPGTAGYVSYFVELFAWVMTVPAYQALWELLYPTVNPYGWGHDFWYDCYASDRVIGHKMGIVSVIKVEHEQGSSGRTDNTAVNVKWGAVKTQEKVYKAHFGISLTKCREKNIPDAWDGAVKGHLVLDNLSDQDYATLKNEERGPNRRGKFVKRRRKDKGEISSL